MPEIIRAALFSRAAHQIFVYGRRAIRAEKESLAATLVELCGDSIEEVLGNRTLLDDIEARIRRQPELRRAYQALLSESAGRPRNWAGWNWFINAIVFRNHRSRLLRVKMRTSSRYASHSKTEPSLE